MDQLCNGSKFWDTNKTWFNSWPEFTECFQYTVLVWLPCSWLWLTAPFYLYYLTHGRRDRHVSSCKFWLKMIFAFGLVVTKLINTLMATEFESTDFLAYMISTVVQTTTFIFSLIIIHLERRKGITTSGVLFIFWFLLAIAGIVPFYTMIIKKTYESNLLDFLMFIVYYALVLCELILNCFAELTVNNAGNPNICPEVTASFLSRLTFAWNGRLLFLGYKNDLTEGAIGNLHPREKSVNYVSKLLRNLRTSKRKENIKNEALNQYASVRYNKRSGDTPTGEEDETTPLLQTKHHSNSNKNAKGKNIKGVSLLKVLWKTLWLDILMAQIWKLFYGLLFFTNPLLLGEMISFVEEETVYAWKGYVMAAILFASILLQSMFLGAMWHQTVIVSLKARGMLISAIFRKALTISNSCTGETTVGEIVNLMSVDAEHIRWTVHYLWACWSSPFEITLSLVLIYQTIGLAMFFGCAVFAVMMPIFAYIVHKWMWYQNNIMEFKDERLKIINEVLNGIKILKLHAWEPSFQLKVEAVRNKELGIVAKQAFLQSMSTFIWTICPYFVTVALFAGHVYLSDSHILDARTVFVVVSLVTNLRVALMVLPQIISYFVQGAVSIRRIQEFLASQDQDNSPREEAKRESSNDWKQCKAALVIENGTFTWGEFELRSINLSINKGELVAIVGQVGAGKSSLISAMLGEMHRNTGQVKYQGKIAYVPQQAWMQNDTLQNNVLFGKPMDRRFYNKVLEKCAMLPDLEMMPGGDLTEIGERGINQSGGQKQRVSLARAVYNDADIYLLDDPLSAVDSHVGKHIFEQVISDKGLLRKKTRILVTHGIQWLPRVDNIIVITEGRVSEMGSYEDLLRHNGPFAQFLQMYLLENQNDYNPEEYEVKREAIKKLEYLTSDDEQGERQLLRSLSKSLQRSRDNGQRTRYPSSEPSPRAHNLVEEEQINGKKVSMSVYRLYAAAMGYGYFTLGMTLFLVYQIFSLASMFTLSQWADDAELSNITLLPGNSTWRRDKNNQYMLTHGLFRVCQAICLLVFCLIFASRGVKASRCLHHNFLTSILRAPMSFFDTTPNGRIVSRFSGDVETIDVRLPNSLTFLTNTLFTVLTSVLVICYSTPLFIAFLLPLGIAYYFVMLFYIKTSRQLKRLERITEAPIYNHFSETLAGISCIRAFQAEERFIRESEARVDRNQQKTFYLFACQRWLAVRLEALGNIVVLVATISALSSRGSLSGGMAGLSISYALQITQYLNWMVRVFTELELRIVSVERLQQYTLCETEAPWCKPERCPSLTWPQSGLIEFKDFSTRYRPGLDLVLKNLTFTISAGEKVGVVGRTGAGKSSLTLSLFRLIEAAGGEINIDGLDISSLGLHDLRKRLTILPQESMLFSGTLRDNVDPLNRYSDREIWTALEHAHLKTFVESLDKTLDHVCVEGGGNISAGQRQLFCLARALLKKTKILVLDEATAAVDMETDDLIQQTIRSEFKDCTVLTIAHRLNTVMDYDRILVLDNGCVVEFDSPSNLLQVSNSMFCTMAIAAGLKSNS